MPLWRISNHADLSGEGGRLAEGRWHRLGQRVVYLAEHPALTLVETLVHLEIDPEDIPRNFRLLSVDVPDDLAFDELPEADLDRLHPGWRHDKATTRASSDSFFTSNVHALLRVPSVLVPAASNFLLNPAHPDASRVRIASDILVAFDDRLLRR
ncbi:MAG: RES family NAD+ phosphorylase [Acetobacterales bacterium]